MKKLCFLIGLIPAILTVLPMQVFAQPKELSFFSIPMMKESPVIDGRIDVSKWPDDEWSRAVRLDGFWQVALDEPAPFVNSVMAGYDEKNLYVAFSVQGFNALTVKCKAAEPDTTAWADECFEFHIGLGENPSETYQFVVNADNVTYSAVNRPGRHDKGLGGNWKHATNKTADGWTAEMAIPWKTLGIEEAKEGAALRMNFAHTATQVEGLADSLTSSWGALRCPGMRQLKTLDCMPAARLAGTSPVVCYRLVYWRSDAPTFEIRGVNPSGSDGTVKIRTTGEFWGNFDIPAGSLRRQVRQLPVNLGDEGTGCFPFSAKDDSGNLIFHHTIPLRSLYSSKIGLKKYFPVDYVEIEVGIPMAKGSRADVLLSDAKGAEIISFSKQVEGSVPPLRVDVSRMPRKEPCMLELSLYGADGGQMTKRRFELTRPAVPEWLGTDAGVTENVVPPYTPIRVRGDGFSCLIKEYAFKGRALPASAKSEEHELLSSPARLELKSGGRVVDIASVPIRVTSVRENRVQWASSPLAVAGITVEHRGWMEEDGFMWCEATLTASRPVEVDGLELLVPVMREFATFFNGSIPNRPMESSEEIGRLEGEGHAFQSFMAAVSVRNYERGLSVVTDDPRSWCPRNLQRSQRIDLVGDAAVMRFGLIENPTVLEGEKTFSFGFMAMPAKPVDRNHSERRAVANVDLHEAVMSSGAWGVSRVEYPVKGNLDLAEGTLELYLLPDFDAVRVHRYTDNRWYTYVNQRIFSVRTKDEICYLFWDARTRGWMFTRTKQTPTGMTAALDWQGPEWRHLALTWGDVLRIYADGKLVAEKKVKGLLSSVDDMSGAIIQLGKTASQDRSEFRVAGIRISGRALGPEEMALDGKFSSGDGTMLLHDFSGAAEGTELPEPGTGNGARLYDSARIERAHGRSALAFGPIPDLSRLEYYASIGVRVLSYIHMDTYPNWGLWDYGTFRWPEERRQPLELFLESCEKLGLKALPYFGYGLGYQMPESQMYQDYWAVQPLNEWKGPGRSYFIGANPAVNYFTDFMLDGISRLLKDFPRLGGLYYDHVTTPYADANLHNGSGWIDGYGNVQARAQVRPAREYIKRLRMIAGNDRYIDSHGSSYVTPMRAAWVDNMWIGELFSVRGGGERVEFDYDTFAIKCDGTAYGMSSDFLYFHKGTLKFSFEESLAYTMLHDMEPRPVAWSLPELKVMEKLWRIKDDFDTDGAEWHPFWRNDEYARVDAKGCLVSLYLHKGRRALVIVSNVSGKGPDGVNLELDLKKMGLKGAARNVWADEEIKLTGGRAHFSLNANDMRLIWIE